MEPEFSMSSEKLAILARNVSKTYTLGLSGRTTPLHRIIADRVRHPLSSHRRTREQFRALDDVSFDVDRGEVVGIIGRNGAGKSTLLKVLTRITHPDTGAVDLWGRVGSLLEVGTGFHPELTGRENIFLNGAILGMKRREIEQRLDAIIDFADVTTFLDTPVKRYSSGMRVRLAFSVAAHLDPELLIVDEVLSVGDANFQRKCIEKMGEVAAEDGRTVLFVSHNLVSVEHLCSRTLYLEAGRIHFDGDTSEAISRYLAVTDEHAVSVSPGEYDLSERRPVEGMAGLVLHRLRTRRDDGLASDSVRMGEGLALEVETRGLADHPEAIIVVVVKSEMGQTVFIVTTRMKPLEIRGDRSEREMIRIQFRHLPLTPGRYDIELGVRSFADGHVLDWIREAGQFHIVSSDIYGTGYNIHPRDGQVFVDWDWDLVAVENDGLAQHPGSSTASRGM
jgi:lipopolysaccharide transport system ATP-binding protein